LTAQAPLSHLGSVGGTAVGGERRRQQRELTLHREDTTAVQQEPVDETLHSSHETVNLGM
jgi:hypothetical protein